MSALNVTDTCADKTEAYGEFHHLDAAKLGNFPKLST
jgi:hypothetical protein